MTEERSKERQGEQTRDASKPVTGSEAVEERGGLCRVCEGGRDRERKGICDWGWGTVFLGIGEGRVVKGGRHWYCCRAHKGSEAA